MASPDPLLRLLAPFHEHPERAGVFTDFDGTLAPIVPDPATASPLPGTVDVLLRLADLYARVGVLSGRPVQFLAERLAGRLFLSGLYGLEVIDGSEVVVTPQAERWRPVVDAAAARAEAALPGALIEHKGLSLTLHYRTAPEQEAAVRAWAAGEAARDGLVVRPARMSIELHPPIEADKGTALLAAAAGLEAVAFFGDDAGDLPAFAALADLRTMGARVLRVGVVTPEAPPELTAVVDVIVDGPAGALEILQQLVPPETETLVL